MVTGYVMNSAMSHPQGCQPGHYLSDDGRSCPACTALPFCTAVECNSADFSACSECAPGYFVSNDACSACTPISGCTGLVTCTGPGDSICSPVTTSTTSTTTTSLGATTTTSTTLPSAADFNCYKVRDLRSPRFVPRRGVSLEDQFGTTVVDVTRPYLLCAPASRDGAPVGNEATHMCCYRTRAPLLPDAVKARTSDGFGTLTGQVRRSTLTCLPCTKEVLP